MLYEKYEKKTSEKIIGIIPQININNAPHNNQLQRYNKKVDKKTQ